MRTFTKFKMTLCAIFLLNSLAYLQEEKKPSELFKPRKFEHLKPFSTETKDIEKMKEEEEKRMEEIKKCMLDLHASKPSLRARACYRLSVIGDTGDETLIREMIRLSKDGQADVREAAITALGSLGNRGDDSLIRHLTTCCMDSDSNVKLAAIRSLGKLGNESTIKYIIGKFSTNEIGIRVSVVAALDSYEDNPDVIDFLINKGLADPALEVRKESARVLGRVGDETKAVSALTSKIVSEKDAEIKKICVNSIEQIKNRSKRKKIVEFLMKDFDTQDIVVKKYIIEQLGKFGDEKIVKLLIEKLEDEPEEIKQLIKEMKEKIMK